MNSFNSSWCWADRASMHPILTVLAVGGVGVAASAAALGIARALRLAAFVRPRGPAPVSVTDMVDRLVAVAEVAKEEGLLRAEQHADPGVEPLLARGIAWSVEGRPLRE